MVVDVSVNFTAAAELQHNNVHGRMTKKIFKIFSLMAPVHSGELGLFSVFSVNFTPTAELHADFVQGE